MYPQGELRHLAGLKAGLHQRIARQRAESARDLARITRPLRRVDDLRTRWRRLGPIIRLAAVPAGLWLTRRIARQRGLPGRLLYWGPALFGLARGFFRPRAPG